MGAVLQGLGRAEFWGLPGPEETPFTERLGSPGSRDTIPFAKILVRTPSRISLSILRQIPSRVRAQTACLPNRWGLSSVVFFFFSPISTACGSSWVRDQTLTTGVTLTTAVITPDP